MYELLIIPSVLHTC